jgi:6-pyruvoyltetrahydropterin/6-carboxytetrahydropterin synthase
MSRAYLTRSISFSAAHRYHRPDWTDEENRRVFGACHNPHGHGHNYTLQVTVSGRIDPATGFSADLALLDELLQREVKERLDHQHLNHAIEEFRDGGLIPTCENIVTLLWPRIEKGLPAGTRLIRLRLHEDPLLSVDYYGGRAAPGDPG